MSALVFLVPYFYIVGYDNSGNGQDKFLWYWLFQTLFMTLNVFLGQFLAVSLPNEATAVVVSGMVVTMISLFCGFMIKAGDFPDFWIFMYVLHLSCCVCILHLLTLLFMVHRYWLSPLHYVIEGMVVTQFHGDHSIVSITGSTETNTAQGFVSTFYSDWRYKTRGYDIMALCLFCIVLKVGSYYCLAYVRHDKR